MNEDNLLVSAEVRALLPDALIRYLYDLASSGGHCDCDEQTFALSPDELGGRSIQSIVYGGERRRVFGFTPVRCYLCMMYAAGRWVLTLTG